MGNVRNGSRAKTMLTDSMGEVDEIVLSLYTKGPATGEISADLAEIYGAPVSKEAISRITDRVSEEMQVWPLDEIATTARSCLPARPTPRHRITCCAC